MGNVPKLRFNEFGGDWRQTQLGSVFDIFQGYAFSSNDAQTTGVRWLKIADVGIQQMKPDSPSYLPADFHTKHARYALTEGDYVMALTRPILDGRLKIAKVNQEYSGALLNQRVGKLQSDECLDFVYFCLQQSDLIQKIDSFILGSEPPNLSVNQVKPIKIGIPALREQQKIAAFLSAVDTKIEQLTKKEQLLQQYKKGVMQKIFSQEIRFKADDGSEFPEWTEHKFHDVYKFIPTNSLSRADLNDDSGVYRNIHYGDIHTKFPVVLDVTKVSIPFVSDTERMFAEYSVCRSGDLVIADASEDYADIGKSVEIENAQNESVVAGLHTILARPEKKMALGFSAYMVQSYAFRKQIYRIAQGAKVLGIPSGQLKKLLVRFPCYEEQLRIAETLRSLDRKIASLNTQTNIAKTFKKGLLQQMFV